MARVHWYVVPSISFTMLTKPLQFDRVLDAVRSSDGRMVTLKRISFSRHPDEIAIGQYLNSSPLSQDPRNHCCPILEVLEDPLDTDIRIIIMPLLKMYRYPSFQTVGEAVEFFRQAFEVRSYMLASSINFQLLSQGLWFMHEHRVAHRYAKFASSSKT